VLRSEVVLDAVPHARRDSPGAQDERASSREGDVQRDLAA
jgi:hypothetical protein